MILSKLSIMLYLFLHFNRGGPVRLIFILLIFSTSIFASEQTLDKLRALQNLDGSFGKSEENKIITTSSVLISYISQNMVVKYSETISASLKFLKKESYALCLQKPSLQHLAALRALSEYYGISRQEDIREICRRLKTCIYKDYSGQKWRLKGKPVQYFSSLSRSLYSYSAANAGKILKDEMHSLTLAAAAEIEMNSEAALFFRFHRICWQLDRNIDYKDLKLGTDSQNLLKMLDSQSSKERKKGFLQALSVELKDRIVLIEALKLQSSLELKLVAGDIAARMKISEIIYNDIEHFKESQEHLQSLSFVHLKYAKHASQWEKGTSDILKNSRSISSMLKLDSLPPLKHDKALISIAEAVSTSNIPVNALCSFKKLNSQIKSSEFFDDNTGDSVNPVLTTTVEEFEDEGLDLIE